MNISDCFERLRFQFENELPFVAYRKPNSNYIKGFLQNNQELFSSETFSESGFLFAPFDLKNTNVLFPLEHSEEFSVEFQPSTLTIETQKGASLKISDSVEQEKNTRQRQHLKLVEQGIDAISKQRFKKVVLSRKEVVGIGKVSPIPIFKRLLTSYTNAFVYIWFHPKVGLWLGATPEMLLSVRGLKFKTVSLAGTRSALNVDDVVWDEKNLKEQQFVTDFIKEELNSIVKTISVSPRETIKAGKLYHLKSEISGILNSNKNTLQPIIESLHPTPAVCGLPKLPSKKFILDNENYNREFYTGFLGELNLKRAKNRNANRRNVENNAYGSIVNETELFVNLRCMQIKDDRASIYVGGGITEASNPKTEWAETEKKARTMLDVLA